MGEYWNCNPSMDQVLNIALTWTGVSVNYSSPTQGPAHSTSRILTLSSNDCHTPSEILKAAKTAGIKVLLGMWPDGGVYQKEKGFIEDANVEQYGDTLFGITVGSEGMYRGTYHADDLIGWIGDMKKSFPNTKIGTADSWNCWTNGTMDGIIKSGIDLVWVTQDCETISLRLLDESSPLADMIL